ncbi:MAG: hypothetical protein ACKVQU_20965 [Burkholderiales bacterium]
MNSGAKRFRGYAGTGIDHVDPDRITAPSRADEDATVVRRAQRVRNKVAEDVIFLAAVVPSIVGFASSTTSGALVLHYVPNGVEAMQIMMICIDRRSVRWVESLACSRHSPAPA